MHMRSRQRGVLCLALSINIPYFFDGILFYDGEKEAFVSTYYLYTEAFYQGLPVEMGEMVRWYGVNARYLIPDESGCTEHLTQEVAESCPPARLINEAGS